MNDQNPLSTKWIIIGLVAIFLFSPKVVLATPTLNITEVPDSATIEESFNVEVVIVNLESTEKYFIKAVGGEDWYDVKTWSDKIDNWLAWNGDWDKMPETIALDDGTSISTISAKFIETTTLGENQFRIKIVKWDRKSDPFYSDVVIDVLPAPTPTPTPGEPTEEPGPTEAPTPTPTPIPTPTPTKKPTPTLIPTPTGEILGEEESATNAFYPLATEGAESTSQSASSFKTRWLPKILLGIGFILLFGAAFWVWYTKLRWPEQESS